MRKDPSSFKRMTVVVLFRLFSEYMDISFKLFKPYRITAVSTRSSLRRLHPDENSSRLFLQSRSEESLWWSCSRHSLVVDKQPQMSSWAVVADERFLLLLEVCQSFNRDQEMVFTWSSGSHAELRGWRKSQDVSHGSSSAGAGQSRSWQTCTWHKTRWLCQESGALFHC